MSPSGCEHESFDKLFVAPVVVLLQHAAELAQGAIDLEGAGEVVLLGGLAEFEELLHVLGAVDEFFHLRLGHARRVAVLRRGYEVVLNHVAVYADEAVDGIVRHLLLFADLDGELEQLDALGVAACGVVEDGGLEPARLVVRPREAADAGQASVAVDDASVVEHDARPKLAAKGDALLGLPERAGVALDDEVLDDAVVLVAAKGEQIRALRGVVLAYPSGDAVVLVVVEQQIALDAVDVEVARHVVDGVLLLATRRQDVASRDPFLKQAHFVPPSSMPPWMSNMRPRCRRSRRRSCKWSSSEAVPGT